MDERWKYDKQELDDNGYGDIYIGDSRAYRHDDYVRIHNADCDTYEAKIAELQRRLEEYEHARGAGHPQPCTLGPLCPYCRIAELEAERDVFNGTACKEEQDNGAGPCGVCVRCLRSRLDRIAALVKPVPVADLVEHELKRPRCWPRGTGRSGRYWRKKAMSEVERFDAYYGYPSCRATGRHIHANGEFVLASDYDRLANSGALVPVRVELSEWYMTPTGLGWWGEDKHGMPCVETPEGYYDAADCYPVRLVQIAEWEAEG